MDINKNVQLDIKYPLTKRTKLINRIILRWFTFPIDSIFDLFIKNRFVTIL